MESKLSMFATGHNIRYFLINFTDLAGVQRSKLVPAAAIATMETNGAGFAGFATHLQMTPASPDMFALPDPASVVQLPWKPEVAWVAGDLIMQGEPVAQAPRVVLKRLLDRARQAGYQLMTGVEAEYHLITTAGDAISDARDQATKPCYDQQAVMRRFDVIAEICDAMSTLGWGPYQNDHEDANGQFEMNWEYADALVTADRHALFKFMVKSIAEKHGLRATFMPKPFAHLTGNGCHIHLSLWNRETPIQNLFLDIKGELGLSTLGYHFLGGILRHARSLCAIANPTVNSYKRINAQATASGATWSPNTISFGGNNRTHMVRIPDRGRFELRLADGATNPYLLPAAALAAGLDGIDTKADCGKRLDIDMYAAGHQLHGVNKLPLYLLDALRDLEKNAVFGQALGEEFIQAYVDIKMQEWDQHSRHLSAFERTHTLDC